MRSKTLNKIMNDTKFYIFEQGFRSNIEKKIESFIEEYNNINDNQITKYRYGLNGYGSYGYDFIIQLFYDNWTYKGTFLGGSVFDAPIEISDRKSYYKEEDTNSVILNKYFGDDELLVYHQLIKGIFEIRRRCDKDYETMKKRSKNRKDKWVNY